ncbi:MAG: hypothetical protein QOH13_1631 [Thermoleophilaceae bacterium]|nr:hypothetical protein [Thermoleophilaceae bacterium]
MRSVEFQIAVLLIGTLAAAGGSLLYLCRVRLDRPPIGVFNGRDLALFGLMAAALPSLFLSLPPQLVTAMLAIVFLSAIVIALRPLVARRWLWFAAPLLLVADIVAAHAMADADHLKPIFWLINSAIVMIAAIGVANLWVQGGLTLRHVAWLTLLLAIYDFVVTGVLSITLQVALSLLGRPLDPEIGFAVGDQFVSIGLGDVLIFCIYTLTAFRAYGRRGASTALMLIAVTGGILPPLLPVLLPDLVGSNPIPVQVLFGPPAFLAYRWLSRSVTERGTRQWLAESAARAFSPPAGGGPRAVLALPAAAVVALVLALVLAAGQPDPVPAQASGAMTRSQTAVTMRTLRFAPRRINVRVGQTITWTNVDPADHNVVATSGASFRSAVFGRGGTYAYRATMPGTISYVCTLHPGMEGTVTVAQ